MRGRLRSLAPPLPVNQQVGKGTERQIVYLWQGGSDIHVVDGVSYAVRSAWLAYVSQPVPSGSTVYVEELQDDADRMHDAIMSGEAVVDGRFVTALRRDVEHALPVYEGTTLVEHQLGGIYIVLTSLT